MSSGGEPWDYQEGLHAQAGRRPKPPPGFLPWKRRGANSNVCPNCGVGPGFGYREGGFQDPNAAKVYAQSVKDGFVLCGALDSTYVCDGVPLFCHWSRYGIGICSNCQANFWHDMVSAGDWEYHYEPNLFGRAR